MMSPLYALVLFKLPTLLSERLIIWNVWCKATGSRCCDVSSCLNVQWLGAHSRRLEQSTGDFCSVEKINVFGLTAVAAPCCLARQKSQPTLLHLWTAAKHGAMSDIFTFVSPEALAACGGGAILRVHNSKIILNFCLSTDCHGCWGMSLTTHLHLAPQLTCVALLPPPPNMPSWHIQEQHYASGWALSS